MLNFERIKAILDKEPKLIKVKKVHPHTKNFGLGVKKIIFVGDTHGDLKASQKVIKDYLLSRQSLNKDGKPSTKIVFLGDYIDRGPQSKENLDFLLETKENYPNQIYLLQGNHEGHRFLKFSPADFWENLSKADYQKYCSIVEKFPLVVIANDIIALHGALPECGTPDIAHIELGSQQWLQIVWGDFSEESGESLGIDPFSGRPQFGRDYFSKLMERFQKNVLIRSHDPNAPLLMFDDRCLTIFTSSAYKKERVIAIADLSKEIKTAKDLEIKRI